MEEQLAEGRIQGGLKNEGELSDVPADVFILMIAG